ncbi:MAG TPA: GNAT family N-acetyltransferase [Candidatus Limnocylindrales bacterium]|jgi:GNAT superfamily N-acetyltransferase|nr:GNAT family N-acetyltransferase [Candidatus Limnocylindrales bacterium]
MAARQLRPMTADDIEPVVAAILADDWGDRRAWFEFALASLSCRAFIAERDDGRPVGTGVLTVHGSVGWIGTIWVASSMRRRGIGLALTEATIDAAEEADCRTLVLVATEAGRPMYERLGFEIQTWYRTMEAQPGSARREGGPPISGFRAFRSDDLHAMIALDRAATGEDRAVNLGLLATSAGTRVLERDGVVAGFVARAPWGGGATVAPRLDDAMAILDARRMAAQPGRRVRCGILLENEAGARALDAAGWTEAWRAPRMIRGEHLDWHPEHIWGQFNHAMG